MKPVTRFKVTIDAGRVFYVYGTSQVAALDVFKSAGIKFSRADVEEDKGEWKTALQEGLTRSGGTVSGA